MNNISDGIKGFDRIAFCYQIHHTRRNMLSNALLSQYVSISDCEWRRWSPGMADSCENNEKTLACSQHIVFLHHACCAGAKIHHRKKSACYVMSNRASELVGSSV